MRLLYTDPAELMQSDEECQANAAARRGELANRTASDGDGPPGRRGSEEFAGDAAVFGLDFDGGCDPFHSVPLLHKVTAWEILWIFFELGMMFDAAHQNMVRSRLDMRGKQGHERAQGISNILFIVALSFRLAMKHEYVIPLLIVVHPPPSS